MSNPHPTHHRDHAEIPTERLVAFSDAVFAIIITITVLEFKVPLSSSASALLPLFPLFLAYTISFITAGTYWNNHHHLLQAAKHVSGGMMWANLHLLFWLSLTPFAAGWLGETQGGNIPAAFYSAILLLCAVAYLILQYQVLKHAENAPKLAEEFRRSKKGIFSLAGYGLAFAFGFFLPVASYILIVLVTLAWFVPDRRIERYLG